MLQSIPTKNSTFFTNFFVIFTIFAFQSNPTKKFQVSIFCSKISQGDPFLVGIDCNSNPVLQ